MFSMYWDGVKCVILIHWYHKHIRSNTVNDLVNRFHFEIAICYMGIELFQIKIMCFPPSLLFLVKTLDRQSFLSLLYSQMTCFLKSLLTSTISSLYYPVIFWTDIVYFQKILSNSILDRLQQYLKYIYLILIFSSFQQIVWYSHPQLTLQLINVYLNVLVYAFLMMIQFFLLVLMVFADVLFFSQMFLVVPVLPISLVFGECL